MPGYDRTRIVGIAGNDLEEFICGICLEVFIKPTVTECCGQTYCYDCISGWLSEHNTCPNDRKILSMDKLKSSPKMVTNLLGNMKIKCDFQENGCNFIVKISDLANHTENECLFNLFRKCGKCEMPRPNHSEELCNNILFKNMCQLKSKNENLERAFEELKKEKELFERDTKVNTQQLLNKIKKLESDLDKANTLIRKKAIIDQGQFKSMPRTSQINSTIDFNLSELPDSQRGKFNQLNNQEPSLKRLIKKFQAQGLISTKVAEVMEKIDRANYCQTDPYTDKPQHIGFGVNISAPYMHARVLEEMKDHLVPVAKALDIGSGSGYITACMSYMVGAFGTVIGVDKFQGIVDLSVKNINKDLEHRIKSGKIRMIVGDGREGYPPEAPYDVIYVGAATPSLPQKLIDQLRPGGLMIVPIGEQADQNLEKIEKSLDGTIRREELLRVSFQPLID